MIKILKNTRVKTSKTRVFLCFRGEKYVNFSVLGDKKLIFFKNLKF